MRRFRSLGLAVLVGLPCALAAVQDSDPPDVSTLSVSTRLVQVDVIVRDGDGPVEGLSTADFVVYVDSTVTQPEVDVGNIEIRLSDGDFARYRESGYEVFRFVNGSGATGYLRVVVRSGSNQAAGSLWIPLN